MRNNPERFAWTVLWLSFLTFCILAVGIPTAIRSYLDNATSSQEVGLEILKGTVLLQERGAKYEVNAAGRVDNGSGKLVVAEGDSFRTVEGSEAMLWLFDGSNVHLWPDTAIGVEQVRSTRYNSSRASIVLNQIQGRMRLEVAIPPTKSRHFEVVTPDTNTVLREGSYSIDRTGGLTEIVTHQGSATVTGAGRSVELLQRERTEVRPGGIPRDPMSAVRDIVRNGDFSEQLNGWQIADRSEPVGEQIPGTARVEVQDGRNVVAFLREGAKKHWEKYLFQPLEKDITDFSSVKLNLDLKVANQSLSGGGFLGSEYPLLLRLKYRDVYNSETVYVRGFFYQNADGNPTNDGQQVPQNEWQTYEVDVFNPEGRLIPRPAYLVWLEIAASGHSFESYVTNIRLIAQ